MRAALFLVTLAVLAACGPRPVAFQLSADDNNRPALVDALARRDLPAAPAPVNASGQPRVFALVGGTARTLVAYDLAAGAVLWRVAADVRSRIWIGGDFVLAVEGTQLVARDQRHGEPRWRVDASSGFVGASADRARAYVVARAGRTWSLTAYDGASGKRLWRAEAAGRLGAPAAHGGLVYVPFLHQWLAIVDGRTGAQITRVRGLDEQISTLRVTSQVAYFGSKRGMFRLDERSASGSRRDAAFGHLEVPAQLDRASYGRDAYDPVQLAYNATDRARVLWDSEPTVSGPMKLTHDGYAIHYYRYVLGFGVDGALRWAYSHPRVDLVASEHTGSVLAGLSATGDLVALDPATGAVRARSSLGIGAPVLGATFDAEGWAPAIPHGPAETVRTLAAIARDRDARFARVKELAVTVLARLPGPEVTGELIGVLADERAPATLKYVVAALLEQRRDPQSLPALTAQLAVRTDAIANTAPTALGPIARAIAGLATSALEPAQVAPAWSALEAHLDAPTTPAEALVHVIAAMTAIGGGAERPALGAHLLMYHVDPELGAEPTWQQAIVGALATHAGPADRALLRYIAADPRTSPELVAAIRAAVGQD